MYSLNKICIFGDSWGCGAWSLPDGTFLWENNGDGYFTEKFKKYYDCVENYSSGGISNTDILKKLKEIISSDDSCSTILVIQTDPIRDVLPFLSKAEIDTIEYKHVLRTNYQNFNDMLLNFYYHNLNTIGEKFNRIINLVGGCSDVNVTECKKYKNLNVACDSFYKLLETKYKTNSVSNTHNILNGVSVFSIKNLKLLNNLINKNKIQKKYQGDYFGYNNDNHPSKKGIDLWVPRILQKITPMLANKN